jgi:EAL domain-containing protein (putative c-di-GMP-specific phosphodiesterase class I)/ActR/RegA family two-component response regulator
MSTQNPPVASLLVVDDSAVQRERTVQTCRALGVPMIYEAASGSEALTLLRMLVLPPDLMIVDLEMPGMDGIELIQQLVPQSLALPLIVASGHETALIHTVETLARNLGLTVLAGLQKPISPNSLGNALARLARLGQRPNDRAVLPVGPDPSINAETLAAAIVGGEIRVHYQPKVDMRTGIVRGVEALARWPRAGSFVPPDLFVALAEAEGLIHALTLQVMRQALAQAAAWNAHGLRLSMAVNLSPRLLERPLLVREVSDLLAEHGLQPDQVMLEITESSVVDCMGAALGVLARLRLKGFGLSIDDYGTGFSSMQQLARIPFTELKIDRSFVHGAQQRKNSRVILQSALDMARQLGLVTVAEGVETLEDWRLLQAFGCAIGQGFLIARPMPPDELLPWLKRHQSTQHELRADAATGTH